MIIYLYIFHENSLLTLEIICLISTLYIIIYLTSLHCFYYVVFNVGYRQYQSHAIINYLSIIRVKLIVKLNMNYTCSFKILVVPCTLFITYDCCKL